VAVVEGLNAAVRFLLELSVLGALGHWGLKTGHGAAKYLLGIGAPLLAALIWAAFADPGASLPAPARSGSYSSSRSSRLLP
jgi:hypothetical protein